MKRLMGTIKKKGDRSDDPGTFSSAKNPTAPQGDSPEAIIHREVTAFCESGAPNSQNAGDEFLHLPAIVDNAESSPAAAKEAANCIRRYLSKENYQRGFAQYNAIMLTRILTDNPAKLFTQNFDKQFVSTTKELLRDGKDMSVQQILRETLDYFEAEKVKTNDTLVPLVEMWRKEKSKSARMYGNYANGPRTMNAPPFNQYQNQSRQSHRPRGLPPPDELAGKIEEAKTTARLLLQTIQSTPSSELLSNELVREFAERASAAHRTIQQYMNSENPHPDEETMLTLIETNDQLNIAMSKHQRSVLQARKAMGLGGGTPSPQPQADQNAYFNPSAQPQQNQYGQHSLPPPPNKYGQPEPPRQNVYSNLATPPNNTYGPPPSQQTMYNQPVPQSPQDMYAAPSGPQRNEEFQAPPGPPPGARGAVRSNDYAYSQAPPPVPSRNRPVSQNVPAAQSAEYGVAENPFSDDAAQPPPQKAHALFDGPTRNGASSQDGYQQNGNSYGGNPQRPGGAYAGTPSYVHRQESATNNVTMHGASPPADSQAIPQRDPVSPVDSDADTVQQRMGNLHV